MQMQVCTCSSDCFTKFHAVVFVVVIVGGGGGGGGGGALKGMVHDNAHV